MVTTRAFRFHQTGGPEQLQLDTLEIGTPGKGELRIRVLAVGLNRAEAMYRAGQYPVTPQTPSLIGYEGVGIIEELGEGVTGFAIGERVSVLPMIQQGQYGIWAEQAIVSAHMLVSAPDWLDDISAAAIWMQYLTAFALIEVGKVGVGDAVIIPAASSSVGLAAIQLSNWAGATSIAATRTDEKAERLLALGADHVIATSEEDLVARVMDITGGKGASAAFDPVGGPYVETLANALAERGTLFVYGGLSGKPTPYPHWPCAFKGLSMRGWVASEIWNDPTRFTNAKTRILTGLKTKALQPVISKCFDGLESIPKANAYLESNQQVGKIVVKF